MKTRGMAALVLLVASSALLAASATGGPLSQGLRPTTADLGVILISDCEVDEKGNAVCSGDSPQQDEPQYQEPRPKKPSKTQQILDAIGKAAEEAAAREREQRQQKAIRDEERRQQKAAEQERKKREAAAEKDRQKREAAAEEKERKRREAAAEKDRQKRQEAQDAKKAKDDAAKAADDKAKADADDAAEDKDSTAIRGPACEGKTCAAGEHMNGDCRCVPGAEDATTDVTILDGKPVDVVIGPSGGFPAPPTLPDSICQLKIGNTTIYCDGYLPDLPPTRNSCTGRTESGCYLRTVNVPKADGETAPACMQFCNKKRPPVISKSQPTPPKDEHPVVAKSPGTPAVLTGTATVYREPQRPQTPAVSTAAATKYVEPRLSPTPAVNTAKAASVVEPSVRP